MKCSPFHESARHHYKKMPAVINLETVMGSQHDGNSFFDIMLQSPIQMEKAIWKKIIDESRGLGVTYRPYLFNEPLLDKRMPEIVRYIKVDPTARVDIKTNATLLTPQLSDLFINLDIDKICFHLPGISRQSFAASGLCCYESTLEHVRYFLHQVNRSGKKIVTQIAMLKPKQNAEEEYAVFTSYWKNYRPNSIVLLESPTCPWQQGESGINKPYHKNHDELSFYLDGTATLCSLDVERRQLVGDIAEQEVLDIWNGEEMRHCRELLDAGGRDKLPLCRSCSAYAEIDFGLGEGYTAGHMAKPANVNPLEVEELN